MSRPPRYITLPAKAEENLLERTNLLIELLNLLHAGAKWIVLHGESGLGKTTLANTLFHEADKTNQYEQFGWIPFNQSLPKSIFEAISDPELDIKGDKNIAFYERIAKDEIRTLKNYETLQLIVIDGVDSEQSVTEHLELLDIKRAHFIITTRKPFSDTRFRNFEISPLTDDEVLHLFSKAGLGRNILTPDELEAIGGNAWLTNLLKKHIPKTSEKAAKDFVGEVFANLATDVQGESLAIPIAQSLFEVAPLSAAECWTLLQFAALPKGNYNLETLVAYLQPETEEELDVEDLDINPLYGFSCFEEEWSHEVEISDTWLSSLISDLVEKGWLTDFAGKYAIHDNTIQILKNEGLNQIDFLPEICNCLSVSYFTDYRGQFMGNLQYENHLIKLLDFVEEDSSEDYLDILWKLITFYNETVDYRLELEARLKHLELSKTVQNNDKIADLMAEVAKTYIRLGQYIPAREYIEKALTSDLKISGFEHHKVADHQDILAEVYRNLGQYEKARDLLEVALASDLKNLGVEHPAVAVRQNNLALVFKELLGQYERARDLLEAAIDSDLKNFGVEHLAVAVRQSNLALIFKELGQYEHARDLMEAALASNLKFFGTEHPSVARSQSNLAVAYGELGQYEKARDLLEASLSSDLKNLGPNHPDIANSQSNLGHAYCELGQYEKARDLFEAALASNLKIFGTEHPSVARSQSTLGNVYRELGQYEKAQDLIKAALTSGLKILGPDHPDLAFPQSYLGKLFQAIGDKEQAKHFLTQAYQLRLKTLGEQHPLTQKTKRWLKDE